MNKWQRRPSQRWGNMLRLKKQRRDGDRNGVSAMTGMIAICLNFSTGSWHVLEFGSSICLTRGESMKKYVHMRPHVKAHVRSVSSWGFRLLRLRQTSWRQGSTTSGRTGDPVFISFSKQKLSVPKMPRCAWCQRIANTCKRMQIFKLRKLNVKVKYESEYYSSGETWSSNSCDGRTVAFLTLDSCTNMKLQVAVLTPLWTSFLSKSE